MMYQDKLVVAIKHDGKVLRETKDLVQLPFGSEFSVLVKNLNSRRAKFTLHIDGIDVLDGTEIIVNANSEVEMKRFIRNGNMDEGNAFKFIERTAAIEDGPRGIKVDDGIVRVEFTFEQAAPIVTTTINRDVVWWDEYYRSRPYYLNNSYRSMIGSVSGSTASYNATAQNSTSSSDREIMKSADSLSANISDVGITVPGSKVEQKFTSVYGFSPENQSHVIILRIAGKTGEVEVAAPVTVKTKQKCVTCGKVNKITSNFCGSCGTSLVLL